MGKKPQPPKKTNPGQSITRFFDKTATQAYKQQQTVSTAAAAVPASSRPHASAPAAALPPQQQQHGARISVVTAATTAAAQPPTNAAPAAAKLSAKQAIKAKKATGGSGATNDSSSRNVKTSISAGAGQHKPADKKKAKKPQQVQQVRNQQQHATDSAKVQHPGACKLHADADDSSGRAAAKQQATAAASAAAVQAVSKTTTGRTVAPHACHQQQQSNESSNSRADALKAAVAAAPVARVDAAAGALGRVNSTALVTGKHKTTAAAAAASRPSRFNPYAPGQHMGMLMSQVDEDMEVAWKASPPKDLQTLLQQQQQQQQVNTSSGTATPAAAAAANSATPPDALDLLQSHGSAKSSMALSQQQQLAPAAAAAAAASSADEVLEKLLDSLSDHSHHHQQQQHADQLAMSTPGGPRLRAFRNHSVVPPSTGNRHTGRVNSNIRHGNAAPGTAVGSNSCTHHHTSNGSSTVKRKQAGLKRRDLFDLLDRVEGLVKRKRGNEEHLKGSTSGDCDMVDVEAMDDEHSLKNAAGARVALDVIAEDEAGTETEGDALVDDILAELGADAVNQAKAGCSPQQQQKQRQGTPVQGVEQEAAALRPRRSRLSNVVDQEQQQQQQQQQYETALTGPSGLSLHSQAHQLTAAASTAGSADDPVTSQQQQQQQPCHCSAVATEPPAAETAEAVLATPEEVDCVPATPAGDNAAAAAAVNTVTATPGADVTAETISAADAPQVAISTQHQQHQQVAGDEPAAAAEQSIPGSTSPLGPAVTAAATAETPAAAAAAADRSLRQEDRTSVQLQSESAAHVEAAAGGSSGALAVAQPCSATDGVSVGGGAAAGVSCQSSQEARAARAAKELEEFELMYGFDDDEGDVDDGSDAAKHATTVQQQQQQQEQEEADDSPPANKRQRVAQDSHHAAAAVNNMCAAQTMHHQVAAAAVGDVCLAGGRADVYQIISEVRHDMTDTHLRCFNPYKSCELHVHLSHPWNDCPIATGDAVNIIGGISSTDDQGRKHVYLDYKQGLFIMHPDVLLSGTSITTALTCTRRAWLSERFAAAGGGPSAAALRGTLLHELLQRLLVEVVGDDSGVPLPGLQQLQQMVVEVLDDFGEKLQEVGLTEKTAAAEMNKHLENISAWLRKYLPQRQQQQQTWQQQQQHAASTSNCWQSRSGRSNSSSGSNGDGGLVDVPPNSGYDQPPRVLIQGVADIEENIWAPRYGLKGQIDASLLVSLTRRQPAAVAAASGWMRGSGYQQQQQQQHGQKSWGAGSGSGQQGSAAAAAAGGFGDHSGHQALGSGWSVAGFSGGGFPHGGASGSGGFSANDKSASGFSQRPQNPSHGGVFGDVRYTRTSSWQQQQQRDATGVLQQLDMNAGLQQGSRLSQPAAIPAAAGTDVCGVAGPVPAAAAAAVVVDKPLRVFKGKLSGAVAASCAVQQSRAAGQKVTQHHHQQQQQQQQQQLHGAGANSLQGSSGGGGGGGAMGSSAWMGGSSGGGRHLVANHQQQQQQQSCDSELLIMPFEFKTGKDYFSHRAQVSLYLLLMEVRYQLGLLPAGLLWNVNSHNMALVPAKQEEIAPLMACRNRLAVHLWQDLPPPPRMLGDAHTCSRCHSASTCAAVHAVVEQGTASSSGMSEAQWDSLAGAVTAAAASWGRKWLNCIDWEEAAGRKRRAEMWAMTGAQRQAKGTCIAGLQYVCSHPVTTTATKSSADKVYLYTFRQVTGNSSSSSSRAVDDRPEAAVVEDVKQQQVQCDDYTAVVDPVDAVVAECISKSQRQTVSSSSSGSQAVNGSSSSLVGMPVAPGDVLILGVDGVQVNVGRVEVAEVDGSVITVASQKALQLERYLVAPTPPAATAGDGVSATAAADDKSNAAVTWRLDRDEAASTAMFQRANILRVASDSSSSRVIRLRQLLIDLEPPQQVINDEQQATLDQLQAGAAAAAAGESAGSKQEQQQQQEQAPAAAAVAGYVRPVARLAMAASERYLVEHGAGLNADQVAVVKRVVQMQDYSLVLGMPGTGKTSTIVHAIRALANAGASVLVTSYTNSALDNILLKLVECGVHDFLRLGRASSCHAGVREYMPGSERYPQRSTAELQQLAASTPIVGCPCLSVHHPFLAARPAFDVVIVDEAGQISLPAVLGALLKARSFVLVGDHYQLPPLVLDKRAAEGGLSVSLFRQLCEAHPGAVVVLKRQYRMCREIMGLANQLIYGGQLEAGSESVEQAELQLKNPDALQQLPNWVSSLLEPSCRLSFINTDSIRPAALAQDSQAASVTGGVVNVGEARLVMQLLDGLLAAGVPGRDIGIISPYKAQVALLQQLLDRRSQSSDSSNNSKQDHAVSEAAAVEVMTIDKCQGRDKDVLMLSFVRSNPRGAVGNLLSDWQRLNVALTRAKVKLLMVGSARTLGGGVPLLQNMVGWVQQEQSLVCLPEDALQQ